MFTSLLSKKCSCSDSSDIIRCKNIPLSDKDGSWILDFLSKNSDVILIKIYETYKKSFPDTKYTESNFENFLDQLVDKQYVEKNVVSFFTLYNINKEKYIECLHKNLKYHEENNIQIKLMLERSDFAIEKIKNMISEFEK